MSAQQYLERYDLCCDQQALILVEEFTHRVLNEYAEAIAVLRLAAAAAPDARSEVTLKAAALRLKAHAEAHRALQAPTHDGPTDLASYIAELGASLTKARLADRGVWLTVSGEEIWLDGDRCWRVGLIVAELIRNATKHGFSGGTGSIRIEVAEAAGRILCEVCDDGNGRPATAGRGRRLVQSLARQLGGSVKWRFTPKGCCVRLEFARPSPAGA